MGNTVETYDIRLEGTLGFPAIPVESAIGCKGLFARSQFYLVSYSITFLFVFTRFVALSSMLSVSLSFSLKPQRSIGGAGRGVAGLNGDMGERETRAFGTFSLANNRIQRLSSRLSNGQWDITLVASTKAYLYVSLFLSTWPVCIYFDTISYDAYYSQ